MKQKMKKKSKKLVPSSSYLFRIYKEKVIYI